MVSLGRAVFWWETARFLCRRSRQSSSRQPVVKLIHHHGENNHRTNNDLAVILVDAENYDATADHLDHQRPKQRPSPVSQRTKSRKVCGNTPMDWPLVITKAMPRKIAIVPKVMMNGCTRSATIIPPFRMPHKVAIPMQVNMPSGKLT